MNERKSKNIVIIALCITLIFMGVGFSALSANLEISGTATVSGEWDVRITEISATSAVIAGQQASDLESLKGNVESNGTLAKFNASLTQPGDYIIYTVTVQNAGNIEAILNNYTVSEDGTYLENGAEKVADTNAIIYTFDDSANPESSTLASSGGTHTFTVKAEYDVTKVGANAPKTDADKTRDYQLFLNYVQN